ncbi:MAG: zinc-ribbon domain-containing protein, partial [Rhodospirillales bacterium]|nr:zinc-ribbon domain-containing protein [Rhodospirillales bacterium]
EPIGSNWTAAVDSGKQYRFCANWELRACNWLVPADGEAYCRACRGRLNASNCPARREAPPRGRSVPGGRPVRWL